MRIGRPMRSTAAATSSSSKRDLQVCFPAELGAHVDTIDRTIKKVFANLPGFYHGYVSVLNYANGKVEQRLDCGRGGFSGPRSRIGAEAPKSVRREKGAYGPMATAEGISRPVLLPLTSRMGATSPRARRRYAVMLPVPENGSFAMKIVPRLLRAIPVPKS